MTCDVCSNPLAEGALFCGECGSSVYSQAVAERREPSDTQVLPKFLDEGKASAADAPLEYVSVFATRARAPVVGPVVEPVIEQIAEPEPAPLPRAKTSYTLTLSTGETLEVSANGLIGRMPQPSAGEQFAHLVIVTDPSRSVSKTHLEFGFDGEHLWVLDRNSGNGSIIREFGKIPRRAEPGRQYLVPRGTRIDMGETQLTID